MAHEPRDEEEQATERVGSSRGDITCTGTAGSKAKQLNRVMTYSGTCGGVEQNESTMSQGRGLEKNFACHANWRFLPKAPLNPLMSFNHWTGAIRSVFFFFFWVTVPVGRSVANGLRVGCENRALGSS